MGERTYLCKNCKKAAEKKIKVGKMEQDVIQCTLFPHVYHPTGLVKACIHYQSKLDV